MELTHALWYVENHTTVVGAQFVSGDFSLHVAIALQLIDRVRVLYFLNELVTGVNRIAAHVEPAHTLQAKLTLTLIADELYEYFCERIKSTGVNDVQKGVFGADMRITQTDDGPVTILLDSRELGRKKA